MKQGKTMFTDTKDKIVYRKTNENKHTIMYQNTNNESNSEFKHKHMKNC